MARKYQIIYGTLLSVVVLLLIFVFALEQTYARYDNVVSWKAVVNQEKSDLVIVPDSPILSEENAMLTIILPATPATIETTLKILSADQEYEECAGQAPFAIALGNEVRIYLGDNTTPAGTYQLAITWETETAETTEATEETIEVQTSTVTFFVNYLGV